MSSHATALPRHAFLNALCNVVSVCSLLIRFQHDPLYCQVGAGFLAIPKVHPVITHDLIITLIVPQASDAFTWPAPFLLAACGGVCLYTSHILSHSMLHARAVLLTRDSADTQVGCVNPRPPRRETLLAGQALCDDAIEPREIVGAVYVCKGYEELGEAAGGTWGRRAVVAAVTVNQVGSFILYLVLIGTTLTLTLI